MKDISFEVQRGESLGIIGRNGCGKSTLLQIVCGMTRPTKGEIWVKGRVAPVLALGATFDLEATGRENVLIGGAVLGLKRPEIIAKFDSIADFAGIGDFMDQPIKLYSTGMRTRLAFAICAHMNAEILIVDEALSVGDLAFQKKCIDWIDNFRRTGTLLFVSHSTCGPVAAMQSRPLDRQWAGARSRRRRRSRPGLQEGDARRKGQHEPVLGRLGRLPRPV